MAVATVIQEGVAANEDEEFQIVVGGIGVLRLEHTAFATAITTGEDKAFELVVGDVCADTCLHLFADLGEVGLQGLAAIDGEPLFHAER